MEISNYPLLDEYAKVHSTMLSDKQNALFTSQLILLLTLIGKPITRLTPIPSPDDKTHELVTNINFDNIVFDEYEDINLYYSKSYIMKDDEVVEIDYVGNGNLSNKRRLTQCKNKNKHGLEVWVKSRTMVNS